MGWINALFGAHQELIVEYPICPECKENILGGHATIQVSELRYHAWCGFIYVINTHSKIIDDLRRRIEKLENGTVAPTVERNPEEVCVGGSNPSGATIADVAQR